MKHTALFLALIASVWIACSCRKDAPADSRPYVSFTSAAGQTLTMDTEVPGMEYSLDGGPWSALGTGTVGFGGGKGTLRLRSKNANGTSIAGTSTFSTIMFGTDAPVECSGDIRTLIDWENYDCADTRTAAFNYLFSGCHQLTSAPDLPLTELSDYCYGYMFNGCTGLASAPELPARKLARFCYWNMFAQCTSLKQAPELPATDLAESCYDNMFWYCSSLEKAPALPATKMVRSCYYSMFYGCSSLTEVPVLPATVLTQNCYVFMFFLCSKLDKLTIRAASYDASCSSFTECLICFLDGAGTAAGDTPTLYVPQEMVGNPELKSNVGLFRIAAAVEP